MCCAIRYDTIRYDLFTCAQKLAIWPAESSAPHRNKNKEKLKQKPISSEETVRAKAREGSPGGKSETTGKGVGFVKKVGLSRE